MGAEALAAALGRGAMPKLQNLDLDHTDIGSQGVAALAAPLRKLPALNELNLARCEIGDEGVASLVANLGKDDFKKLEGLFLQYNMITDAGMTTIAAALHAGGLPKLRLFQPNVEFTAFFTPASASAVQAVNDAWKKRFL